MKRYQEDGICDSSGWLQLINVCSMFFTIFQLEAAQMQQISCLFRGMLAYAQNSHVKYQSWLFKNLFSK